MKNEVLSFVYNMLPSNEREELEAIKMTDEDKDTDEPENDSDSDDGNYSESESDGVAETDAPVNDAKKVSADAKSVSKNDSLTQELESIDELPVVIKGSDSSSNSAQNADNEEMHQVTFNQRTDSDDFDDNK